MRNRWRGRTALIALQGVAASAPFGAQDTAFEPVTDEMLADPDHAAPHAVRGDDRRSGGLHGAVDDLAAALPTNGGASGGPGVSLRGDGRGACTATCARSNWCSTGRGTTGAAALRWWSTSPAGRPCGKPSRSHQLPRGPASVAQNTASGLIAEPAPFGTPCGEAMNRNSQRFSSLSMV